MQLLKDLQEQIDHIWEPVLCPVRTQVHEELLGPQYISIDTNRVYKREDGMLKSFDGQDLVFSTFIKVNERMKSLVQYRESSIYKLRNSNSPKKIINDFRIDHLQSNYLKRFF